MSEQINKVLASTAQAFTTAEQKQARDNIGAMVASASSLFYSTSNPSAFISAVNHDSNLSGSGTVGVPLGLNTSITLAKNGESATLAYDHLTLANSDNDPIISAANGDVYMSGHAGNASSPYTANYGLQGMHVYGTDTYNHITATATLRYSGGTFVEGADSAKIKASGLTLNTNNRQNTVQSDKMELTAKVNPLVFSGTYRPWGWDISGSATSTTGVTNPKTAIVQSTSYFSMYNTSDDNEKAQGYFTFRGCGFGSSGAAGVAGDELHTNISTLGITSISGYMGTASSHTGFYLNNGADPDRPLELKFESGASNEKVDIDSIRRWNSYSAATQVVSRSYPYTDTVAYTGLTIYNPYETYGATLQDPSSTTIGYLVPKYLAPADLGKVLTVVSDDGYKCKWQDPTGGIPQITPMGSQTYYASGNDYIDLEDNVAYFIETNSGGSFTIHLGTLSRQTIHSKIYLVGTQANCVTMTVVYEDEAGQVCQLNFVYGDSQSDTYYGLDVYARLVTIGGGGSISFDTTMCRVYDYPCQNRDYFSSDNNNIGLVVDYMEPL